MSMTINCRYELSSRTQARLSTGSVDYADHPNFDEEIIESLLQELPRSNAYGELLFKMLFPKDGLLYRGYRDCWIAAKASAAQVCFQLSLANKLPLEIRNLEWENVVDDDEVRSLSISRKKSFSRRIYGIESRELKVLRKRPRLLIAISSPLNAPDYHVARINADAIKGDLRRSFRKLSLKYCLSYKFLGSPVTIGRLQKAIESNAFDILHLVAHGGTELMLENSDRLVRFIDEDTLCNVISDSTIRLVMLMACGGYKPSTDDPFSSLAERLIRGGTPAVVAMRRKISVEAAVRFSRSFYAKLWPEGRVDIAVNHARRQLSTAFPYEWTTPVLLLQLSNGRLWPSRRRVCLVALIVMMCIALLLFFYFRISRAPDVMRLPPAIQQKVHDAGSYVTAGGGNTKKGLDLYLKILQELRYEDGFLTQAGLLEVLKKAQEAYNKRYYEESARLYKSYFDKLRATHLQL